MASHFNNAPAVKTCPPDIKAERQKICKTKGFTDNQWYCHLARQTVFFSAFSNLPFARNEAVETAHGIFKLAPHILQGYGTGLEKSTMDENMISGIISLEHVKSLDDYPDKWSLQGTDIFDNPNLPPLRIKVAILEKAPDEKGRFSAILILSTHSMFEGVDATSLARSRSVRRGAVTKKPAPVSMIKRFGYESLAAALAPLQLLAAFLFAPRTGDVGFKTLVISRSKLRLGATKLGISQQALIFALASYAINGKEKLFSKKCLSTLYADLNQSSHFKTNDEFFQFRMIDLDLLVKEDFADFALGVAKALQKTQNSNRSHTQTLLNAMFGMHRRLYSLFPFLYTPQLFRFSAGYDFTLSLTPPQHIGEGLTKRLMEPVFTGTYHPGFNMCVFSPGRTFVTFSFSLRQRYLNNVENIPVLLDNLLLSRSSP